MKKRLVVAILVVVCFGLACSAATKTFTNTTGQAATQIVVTFSELARVTSYTSDVFPTQSPASGESESFTFSGGTLPAGGTFQVTWSPSSARVRGTKWITPGLPAVAATSLPTIPTTYEEIMAQIAHYPGPDEPLYVPAEGEQIWLTDLEGHADIYDNDSIKINYAPSFDRNQITKVEVYRNGIKMQFLPEKLDVLTNEQMKTFDGNPAERTPKSNHTDHAVMGYEYELRFYNRPSGTAYATRAVGIKSAVKLAGTAYVQAGEIWLYLDSSDAELRSGYRRMKEMGFEGIQFTVDFFMASDQTNEIFAQYTFDATILPWWARTMTDSEIRRVIRLIKEEGLKAEMRVELWLTDAYVNKHPGAGRCCPHPPNWDTWFKNYTAICVEMAKLAQEGGCDIFTPLVELIEPEKHPEAVRALLKAVSDVYFGDICVSQATHGLIWNGPFGSLPGTLNRFFEDRLGHFWDWTGGSRTLLVGIEHWPGFLDLDSQSDQRFSVMVANLVKFYAPVVDFFRNTFPGHPIRFSEMGSYEYDGAVLAARSPTGTPLPDHQEFSDSYAALICVAALLDIDACVWSIWPAPEPNWYKPGQHYLNYMPVMDLVDAMIP